MGGQKRFPTTPMQAPTGMAHPAEDFSTPPEGMHDRRSGVSVPQLSFLSREDVGQNGLDFDNYSGLESSGGQQYMYPIPYTIRNTFIDCSTLSPSLREFHQERKVHSAPTSRMLPPGSGHDEQNSQIQLTSSQSVMTGSGSDVSPSENGEPISPYKTESSSTYRYWDATEATPRSPDTTGRVVFLGQRHGQGIPQGLSSPEGVFFVHLANPHPTFLPSASCSFHVELANVFLNMAAPSSTTPCAAACPVHASSGLSEGARAVKRTATSVGIGANCVAKPPTAAFAEPELGSPEMPTVGSALHADGRCRPCAFAHIKGCGSGVECKFCHLCEPGEKKRRRKEKLERRRSVRGMQQTLLGGVRR